MNTLVIEPTNEADYRLIVDIAKRLNVPYKEGSQSDKKPTQNNSPEDAFYSLYGALSNVSTDDLVETIENARTSKESTVTLTP